MAIFICLLWLVLEYANAEMAIYNDLTMIPLYSAARY